MVLREYMCSFCFVYCHIYAIKVDLVIYMYCMVFRKYMCTFFACLLAHICNICGFTNIIVVSISCRICEVFERATVVAGLIVGGSRIFFDDSITLRG